MGAHSLSAGTNCATVRRHLLLVGVARLGVRCGDAKHLSVKVLVSMGSRMCASNASAAVSAINCAPNSRRSSEYFHNPYATNKLCSGPGHRRPMAEEKRERSKVSCWAPKGKNGHGLDTAGGLDCVVTASLDGWLTRHALFSCKPR